MNSNNTGVQNIRPTKTVFNPFQSDRASEMDPGTELMTEPWNT